MDVVWTSPVRYVECDQQGVVFNGHYLTWADEGFTAFLAARGTPYPDLLARGLDAVVKATTLTWAGPARWGDVVEVACGPVSAGRTSFVLDLSVRAGGQEACTVRTTYVLVDEQGRPTALPDDLRAAWG